VWPDLRLVTGFREILGTWSRHLLSVRLRRHPQLMLDPARGLQCAFRRDISSADATVKKRMAPVNELCIEIGLANLCFSQSTFEDAMIIHGGSFLIDASRRRGNDEALHRLERRAQN